jgi:hypothetical protein
MKPKHPLWDTVFVSWETFVLKKVFRSHGSLKEEQVFIQDNCSCQPTSKDRRKAAGKGKAIERILGKGKYICLILIISFHMFQGYDNSLSCVLLLPSRNVMAEVFVCCFAKTA